MRDTCRFQSSFGAIANQMIFELNLLTPPVLAHPTPHGNAFSEAMLHDMLSQEVALNSSKFNSLLQALWIAITSRDVHVTRLIWTKIDAAIGVDWSKPHGPNNHLDVNFGDALQTLPIEPELLRFLLCFAHLPRLAVALRLNVYERTPNVLQFPIRTLGGPYPSNCDEKHQLIALAATVVSAITVAQHKGVDVDGAWHVVLDMLISAIPRRPSTLMDRHDRHGQGGQSAEIIFVVLDCSKKDLCHLNLLLSRCTFAYITLNVAFERVLRGTVLDDHLALPAIQMIYAQIMKVPRTSYREAAKAAMGNVWLRLGECEAQVVETPVLDVEGSGEVKILTIHGDHITSPARETRGSEFFVNVFNALVQMHVMNAGESGERVSQLACTALNHAMLCNYRTVIVGALIDIVLELKGERVMGTWNPKGISFLAQQVPQFVRRLVGFFRSVFQRFCPVEFAYEIRKLENGDLMLENALREVLKDGNREGMHSMLTLLQGVPKREDDVYGSLLKTYVTSPLCANVPLPERHHFSDATLSVHYNEMKRDLEHFLQFGSPWNDEDLQLAMESAVKVRSGIATQVLASPPYNVPMPAVENAFVNSIMAHVLAPGAPAVREARDRFVEHAAL